MDSRITLSFDEEVINKAKKFADNNNISLSRLTEFLLRQLTSGNYKSLEDLPVSDWVHTLSEGDVKYTTKKRGRKSMAKEFLASRK